MANPTLQDLQRFRKSPTLPAPSSASTTLPPGGAGAVPSLADLQKFKKTPEAPIAGAATLPEPGFLDKVRSVGNKIGEVGFDVEKGIVKGAMDTVATVPLAVNKVVGTAVGLKTGKEFTEAKQSIADSNNKLLEIRKKLDPNSDRYKRITAMIDSGVKTLQGITEDEAAANAEIESLASGEKPEFLKPKTTAEKIGYGAEKVGEFIFAGAKGAKPYQDTLKTAVKGTNLPTGAKKVAEIAGTSAIEGITAGAVTAAQGGDLKDITRNTVLSALISVPFKALDAVRTPAADYLKTSAEKKATQALAPTTRYNKELADKTVPEMLRRKVRYVTRGGLYKKASEQADDVGQRIGDAFDALPDDAKTTIAPIFQNIEDAKSKLFIEGTTKVPEAAAGKYKALQNIQDEILSLASEKSQEAIKEINRHMVSASQVVDDLGTTVKKTAADPAVTTALKNWEAQFREGGLAPLSELVKNGAKKQDVFAKIIDETATQLKAAGKADIASSISKIDPSKISTLDDLKGLMDEAAGVGPSVSDVLASAKNNVVGSLKRLGMDTSKLEAIDPSNYSSVKEFTQAVNEATGELTSVSSRSIRSFRQILDKTIKESKGGFGFSGSEKAGLLATKEAANSMREVLASNYPDIAALNKEYIFWKNVQDIVGSTIQRTKGQGTSLGTSVLEGSAAIVGAQIGGTVAKAGITAAVIGVLGRLFKSPVWRNTSAIFRNTLADNIANGNAEKVLEMANRVLVGVKSKPSTDQEE